MHQINSNFGEESSALDYVGNFSKNLSYNLSGFFPSHNPKEKIPKVNDTNSKSPNFIKEFDKVFNKEININKNNEVNNDIDTDNSKKVNCFPFTEGIGLKKCLKNIGYSSKYTADNKILIFAPGNPHPKRKIKRKLKIFYYALEGQSKKAKNQKRRYKPDDIRKRIKTKFHKTIKDNINLRLKKAGSIKLFQFFPQNFISNITINLNKLALKYTYEELIKTNIASDILKLDTKIADIEKYRSNIDVLNHSDRNPSISMNSSFDIIKKMKYQDLLNAYFVSKEFENSIIEMFNKKERIDYIEKYINEALNYVKFFLDKKIPQIGHDKKYKLVKNFDKKKGNKKNDNYEVNNDE